MLGAATLLYQATGDRRYLAKARAIATAAIDFYDRNDRWFTQPARFNAIFFKNLLILYSRSPDPVYRRVVQRYADTVWDRYQDQGTGLFPVEPEQRTVRIDGRRPGDTAGTVRDGADLRPPGMGATRLPAPRLKTAVTAATGRSHAPGGAGSPRRSGWALPTRVAPG